MAFDATPLLGVRTGIGRYVEHVSTELAGLSDELDLRAVAFSLRRRSALAALPSGIRPVHRPVPARLLHRAWLRGDLPPAEWLAGRVNVFHGTNFVLPPLRRGAGVVTVHDLTFLRYPELVDTASLAYRDLAPRSVRRAAVVLTPSQAVANEIADAYAVRPERIRVTPLGVDESWFEPLPPRPAGFPAEYFLAVGTLQPRKGLDVLLRAYRIALSCDQNVPPLVLVGPPGWGAALQLEGIPEGRVILPGYVGHDSLRALIGRASALAFPSRYEGFGLPPLEALAAGTPVVASDVPAIREVVADRAHLVPPGDADALAAALLATLAHPPSPTALAEARRHATTFTWRRCAEQTLEAYRVAAAQRTG